MIEVNDYLGNKLEIGDEVIYIAGYQRRYFKQGVVTKVTPHFVFINANCGGQDRKEHSKVIKK